MKLNLGCGSKLLPGYINVDKSGAPDVVHDLESFPWPWPDNSVAEARLVHILEHLGKDSSTFKKVVQELYRVCRHDAAIHIVVPHPRHDSYLGDPTHVRPITDASMHLLSHSRNLEYQKYMASNSCLAMDWAVDFEIDSVIYHFDDRWKSRLHRGQITAEELMEAALDRNNVIEQLEMNVRVVKPSPPTESSQPDPAICS